jgi:hypothetical protein
MSRSAVRFVWILCAAALAARRTSAQADPAAWRTRAEAAGKAAAKHQEASRTRLAEVRKAIGDPDNKVHGDLDEVEGKVGGLEFAGALGALDLADGHLEYVAEPARPAVKSGLDVLRKVLKQGEQAKACQDVQQELGDRLEHLQRLLQEQADVLATLRDLDQTLATAQKWGALTRAEQLSLRGYLAGHQSAAARKQADQLRERAKTELQQLEQEFGAIAKAMTGRGNPRDSAFAQFDQAQASIADALAQLPEGDAATKELRTRLHKLEATAREAFAKAYGTGILERVKGSLDTYSHEFEGWQGESGTVTAEEYLKIDCTVSSLAHPRTAAMVNRGNGWLTFVGTDAEFQRAVQDQKLEALYHSVVKDRDTAVARLVATAEALVADIEKAGLADEVQRNRAAVLADWELRLLLQEHPRQWELIARLQKLTDAFDRKALGDEAALAKIRDEAVKAAEANWTRMQQTLPLVGGFVARESGKFQGSCLRLEPGRNHADDFAAGDFDLVFRIDGELFAARLDPAVKAAVAAASARTGTPLTAETEYEVVVVVGAEGTLTLPTADGKGQGTTLPCRGMKVIGLRIGPIAFIAR